MKQLILILALGFSSLSAMATEIFMELSPQVSVQAQDKPTDYLFYNFGRVELNSRRTAVYNLKNTGAVDLKIERISIVGVYFNADTNCLEILPAGQTCMTAVAYWPAFEGLHSGRLVWETSENDIVLDLMGQGVRN